MAAELQRQATETTVLSAHDVAMAEYAQIRADIRASRRRIAELDKMERKRERWEAVNEFLNKPKGTRTLPPRYMRAITRAFDNRRRMLAGKRHSPPAAKPAKASRYVPTLRGILYWLRHASSVGRTDYIEVSEAIGTSVMSAHNLSQCPQWTILINLRIRLDFANAARKKQKPTFKVGNIFRRTENLTRVLTSTYAGRGDRREAFEVGGWLTERWERVFRHAEAALGLEPRVDERREKGGCKCWCLAQEPVRVAEAAVGRSD